MPFFVQEVQSAILGGAHLPIPEAGSLPGPSVNSHETLLQYSSLIRRCMARKLEKRPSFSEIAKELRIMAKNEPERSPCSNEAVSLCVICMELPVYQLALLLFTRTPTTKSK